MHKRLMKNCVVLPRDRRGSAIIVVLVTMAFVSVLVIVLLSLSLTNIQMKKMDRGSKANFYSADSAMNEVRAGIQASVSEAIKKAYSSVLVNYNSMTKEEQITNFTNQFYTNLYASMVYSAADSSYMPLFNAAGTSYSVGLLINFVTNPAGVTISGAQTVQQTADGTGILMKSVTVKYIANGYQTTVSSDVKITTPQLPYTSTTITQTPAPSYSIIAKGILQQPAGAGTATISGSVYAGGLTVGGSGDVLNAVNAENFVLAGPVEILGGTLNFNMNSSLWATKITLDAAGRVALAGDAYIANDLNLLGSGTQAVLSGRYFGYGNSTTDPNASSAILINGRDTTLDMSALRALMLAGHGYVNYAAGANGYVLTGESISVKPNQLAYLVPDNCLVSGVSNPYAYITDPGNALLQTYVLLNQAVMNNKTLADYGITSTANNIQYIRKSVGTTNLVYFCLKFPTADAANAYFKDYYNANGPTVSKYLDLYTDGILLQSTATKNLAGEAFTFNGTALGPIIDASGVPAASISGINSSYSSLCVTLSRTDPGSGASNAYDYFVVSSQLAAVSGTRIYSMDGTPKAAVTNGSYTIDAGTNSNIHLVIASGDVTVRRDFQGLILAGGTVTLYNSVTENSGMVQDALKTLSNDDDGDGVYVYNYLNPQHISPLNTSTNSTGVNGWDLSVLVSYQNWAKNEA